MNIIGTSASVICINPDCAVNNNNDWPVHNLEAKNVKSEGFSCPCNVTSAWNLGWKSKNGNIYFLRGHIGKGGGGSIYKAYKYNLTDKRFEEGYAIKILRDNSNNLEESRKQLDREIEGLQQAYNAGARVPKYIDHYYPDAQNTNEQHSYFFLVQEFIEGDNLEKILQQEQQKITIGNPTLLFEERRVFNYLIEMLKDLHLLYRNQVLHRDIKPLNIICRKVKTNSQDEHEQNLQLYLVDFGSSKLVPIKNPYFTINYSSTILYAPPETLSSKLQLSKEDRYCYELLMNFFYDNKQLETFMWTRDLYSLAVTMFSLLIKSPSKLHSCYRWNPSDNEWNKWMLEIEKKAPNIYPILEKMSRFFPNKRYKTAIEALLDASTEAWYAYGDNIWLLSNDFLRAIKSDPELPQKLTNKQNKFIQQSQKEHKKQRREEISRDYENTN
ncbi:protein kinase domain-containing protein [Gloeothece verrucosa]|uniref:Serine/threonine protein kinase n=1 Tax=Gloeothece verrucosa (strain PCC 7822) TaxID=497965 RepID=E0U9K2_GLOV7|nr:protein kinase [Gloeothece verrucosa]ADN13803.1 serine/threonine protein kinase [Gloeothece verrucosa PCC 7822]